MNQGVSRYRGHHGAFGNDRFGVLAERFARLFGTPQFILAQTAIVAVWLAVNAAAITLRWDPYPFILLNLAFSTQAAYAAPLILLAQTRQADRDRLHEASVQEHHDAQVEREKRYEERQTALLARESALQQRYVALLQENTALTRALAEAAGVVEPPGRT